MSLFRSLVVVVVASFLSGCATPSSEKEGSSSGRGVGVSGYSRNQVQATLIPFISEQGYELVSSEGRTLQFDRPASKWTQMRYGSFVNPETFVRMQVFIMEVGAGDLWIGFEPLVVTERGTGFEKDAPAKGGVGREMQHLLEDWRRELGESASTL